jgi:hypothetical protein
VRRASLVVVRRGAFEIAGELREDPARQLGLEAAQRIETLGFREPRVRLLEVAPHTERDGRVVHRVAVARIALDRRAEIGERLASFAEQVVRRAARGERLRRRHVAGDGAIRFGPRRLEFALTDQRGREVDAELEALLGRETRDLERPFEAGGGRRGVASREIEEPELAQRIGVGRILAGRLDQQLARRLEERVATEQPGAARVETRVVDARSPRRVEHRELAFGVVRQLADLGGEDVRRHVLRIDLDRGRDELVAAGDGGLRVVTPVGERGARRFELQRDAAIARLHLALQQAHPVLDGVGEAEALAETAGQPVALEQVVTEGFPALGIEPLEIQRRLLVVEERELVGIADAAPHAPLALDQDPVEVALERQVVEVGGRDRCAASFGRRRRFRAEIVRRLRGPGEARRQRGEHEARGHAEARRVLRRRAGDDPRSRGADLRQRRQIEAERRERIPVARGHEEVALARIETALGGCRECELGHPRRGRDVLVLGPRQRRLDVRVVDPAPSQERSEEQDDQEEPLFAIQAHRRASANVASRSIASAEIVSFRVVRCARFGSTSNSAFSTAR